MPIRRVFLALALAIQFSGCVTAKSSDYSAFRQADPQSILIVPVVNNTLNVDAPDYFLTTIPKPVAERGYYVYPIHAVKRIMEDEGLADANLVHSSDPKRLAELFGADAVLYIEVDKWEAKYVVLKTVVTVTFNYRLVAGETGDTIWRWEETMQYSSQGASSGFLLADLLSEAVMAAATRAAPNYLPLAQTANWNSIWREGQGLPAGKYHPDYQRDLDEFPVFVEE